MQQGTDTCQVSVPWIGLTSPDLVFGLNLYREPRDVRRLNSRLCCSSSFLAPDKTINCGHTDTGDYNRAPGSEPKS